MSQVVRPQYRIYELWHVTIIGIELWQVTIIGIELWQVTIIGIELWYDDLNNEPAVCSYTKLLQFDRY